MAATELRVLFEQALLWVETECLGLIVLVAGFDLLDRVVIHLAILVQHLEQGLAFVLRHFGQEFRGPDFVGGEAFGELHQLPQIGFGIPRRADQLVPELGAALGVAESAFLFHPHCARQDQVGGLGRHGGVDVRDNHEIIRVAPAGQHFLHDVGPGMHVVAGLGPVDIEYAVLEHATLLHGVETDFLLDGALGQFPDFFRRGAVLGIGHHQVGRQPVGEGADFPCGAAGRGLARQ
ncbi:hypothetical protein D3C73_830600 [compost metagenome]